MSTAEDEFDWVSEGDLFGEATRLKPRPALTGYIEQQGDEQFFVAQENLNPYGWIACSETVEVRP